MCAGWNIWCTEQWPFQSRIFALADLLAREAAHFQIGIPDHHLVQRNAHLVAGPAAEVLVGEEQHLLAPGEGPFEDAWRRCDEVHTMPPCSPQKAFRSAAELM